MRKAKTIFYFLFFISVANIHGQSIQIQNNRAYGDYWWTYPCTSTGTRAQSFITGASSINVTSANVLLKYDGYSGNIFYELYSNNNNGTPGTDLDDYPGSLITNGSSSTTAISSGWTTYALRSCSFGTSPVLSANTKYWIVVKTTATDILVGYSTDDSSPWDIQTDARNIGSCTSWTANYDPGEDIIFNIYGTTVSCTTPSTQASNLNFSAVTCSTITVGWTNGNGTKRIVKCNSSNSFTAPVDGTDPAVDNSWNGAGEQVIYNSTSNSATVTGLTGGTTYWFKVYEGDCTGTNVLWSTASGTNNPLSQTTADATPATPGTIGGTAMQCPSVSGQTYSISPVSGATSYNWTVPTGWSITSGTGTASIVVTTGTAGQNGSITVTATNACGTSSASTLAVTSSNASPDASDDQYICSSATSVTLAGSGLGTWSFVNGPATPTVTTPGSLNSTVTGISTSGTYVLKLSGCSNSYDYMLIIKQ